MALKTTTIKLMAACSLLGGCAAAPSSPAASPQAPSAPVAVARTSAATADAGYVDPTESAEPITLKPLFGEGAPRSSFPAPKAGDIGCLGNARTTGEAEADYASLVAACGAPTGMAEYTQPVSGRLHGVADKSDTYAVRLAGGYCYRVFAAGDRSIVDLDVHVRAAIGARIADDKTAAPVAIAGSDDPFCVATTGDYFLDIAVNGPGFGAYTFGVWARPTP